MSNSSARRRMTLPAAGAMSVAAAALVLAGCGSSSNTPSSGASSGAGGDQETIATSSTSMGTFLTADGGRSIYLWEGDHGSMSSCSSACAAVWPPVTTKGAPKAGPGVNAALLGTTKRSDGTTQVTYKGHPLYYYTADTSKGQTNGEGNKGFGAEWYLVQPSGATLEHAGSSSSSPSPSSGGGGYGY
ncbi:MAG: COG4315 family predicted lipoprotein [Marmoricola sp.]